MATAPDSRSLDACVHHWIVETPTGETSTAVCKWCGASRQFINEASRAFSMAKKTGPRREA
jgi:hypothetical protein